MSGPSTGEPIRTTRSATPRPRPSGALGFGRYFTDHMFLMDFDAPRGWHAPRIEPYRAIPLDPATSFLHYGQGLFEGLKAYRGVDRRVRLFRPDRHIERFLGTAERMCIPPVEPGMLLRSWTALVAADHAWIPEGAGKSLYVRPVVIAAEPALGVRPASRYLYFVILSPVDSYYAEGANPVRIKIVKDYARTVAGGIGEAKTPANYAASLFAAHAATREGFAQVLWLDGAQRRYVEEVGTMNFMAVIDGEVLTPALSGSILPGVTRDSVLQLLREWGIRVRERPIDVDELMAAARAGRVSEAWGTGTAAVISPIGELSYEGESVALNSGSTGTLTGKLYRALQDIQYGTAPRPDWTLEVQVQ
jgi:branched-chain amino acid aminotransferase